MEIATANLYSHKIMKTRSRLQQQIYKHTKYEMENRNCNSKFINTRNYENEIEIAKSSL